MVAYLLFEFAAIILTTATLGLGLIKTLWKHRPVCCVPNPPKNDDTELTVIVRRGRSREGVQSHLNSNIQTSVQRRSFSESTHRRRKTFTTYAIHPNPLQH